MSIFIKVSSLALRQAVDAACTALGVRKKGDAVVGYLVERFTDHSQRLAIALRIANDKAWKALEIALVGDSLWERCKAAVARAEDRAFAEQVRAFLDATPLPELAGKSAFRQKCLDELRAARKGRALAASAVSSRELAEAAAEFARFSDPRSLVDAEWGRALEVAHALNEAGHKSLAWLLSQRPADGRPLLVLAAQYFFRRAVEADAKLFQGLAMARLEGLGEAQERGFASLETALAQQGQRLEQLLDSVQAVVVQTHSAVVGLQAQLKGQGEQMEQIGQAVMKLLEQHELHGRAVRPGDSLSIRNDGERQLVRQLVERYRSLPEGQRHKMPSLLNAIGKLEVVAGNFDAAQEDFQQVATLATDPAAQAEARFNAYQAALERRDFDTALKELIEAIKLDARRYAPFPVGKYHPLRILGAGGFGTAFLCRHRYMNADVVVKALHLEGLGQDTETVFTEAQVLRKLDHPAIIRISECGYVDPAAQGRPHLIMDYFEGQTLEANVREHGPMPVADVLAVAAQVAQGLQAAHSAAVLHRDVKPANLLVRKEASGWKVKIIDFGLALPQKVVESSQKASTARQKETMIGSSVAGTMDYGAPEQMGRRKEPVGPYSDVYGWAKTCCYALFQTTQPLMKHWKSVPEPLAELLGKCLEEDPKQRPAHFAEVLQGLATGDVPTAPAVPEQPRNEALSKGRAIPKKSGKRLLPWALGALGALALVIALVILLRPDRGPQTSSGSQPGEQDTRPQWLRQLKGKARLDEKTGLLTIDYDFTSNDQLHDFELGTAKPVAEGGALKMRGGDTIRHIVPFQTLTVKAEVKVGHILNDVVRTTKGAGISTGNSAFSYDAILVIHNAEVGRDNYAREDRSEFERLFPLVLEVEENRVGMKFGKARVGKAISEPLGGQVELSGGTSGIVFQRLVLSGKVAPDWARQVVNGLPTPTATREAQTPGAEHIVKQARARFKAKIDYHPDSDSLVFAYDLTAADQLQDFELKGASPALGGGTLKLQPGQTIRHRASFRTLSVKAEVKVEDIQNQVIQTTKGAGINTSNSAFSFDALLMIHNAEVSRDNYAREDRSEFTRFYPMELEVESKRVGMKFGKATLGKAASQSLAGQVELLGGPNGVTFQRLVIAGRIDPEWARDFFK